MQKRVLVAVSGGVDSAVAAALLLREGFDVTAVFLCLQMERAFESNARSCCTPQDAADARRIAAKLGVKFISLPASKDFEAIINNFIADYETGRTPNPCVRCNEKIKFGKLFELADSLGVQYVATGHYARIIDHKGQLAIAPALAPGKDQSYVLFSIPREKFDRILFPIGRLKNKQAVREIAKELGLEVHDKPDSQDICFVPDGDYVKLLEAHNSRALRPGNIIDQSGKIVGKHDGYGRFTIGQRRGTGVAAGQPVYVTDINPQTADVTIGTKKDLLVGGLTADCANWQVDVPASFDAKVKIRYNHRGATAKVLVTGKDTFEVRFDKPLEAVTPGQAAVVYSEECLLGGGWIKGKLPPA
ncbi:MAG: tRNA 2-thiouridine(34) synthase MnmA [Sedimentisphaerales bacterium]|jgi:tRNA-specific 2-thiouridylase